MLSMFREQDCKAGRTKELATKQRLYKSLSLANLFYLPEGKRNTIHYYKTGL